MDSVPVMTRTFLVQLLGPGDYLVTAVPDEGLFAQWVDSRATELKNTYGVGTHTIEWLE